MPYIGNEPADRFTSIPTVQQFNGDGSTTAFTLSRTVSSDQDILVSVDGVIQDTAAYAVSSGTTLTFSAAPSTGTANIFVNHLGLTIGSVVHPASSALVATTGTFNAGGTFGGAVLAGASVNNFSPNQLVTGENTDGQAGLNIQTSATGSGYVLFGDGAGAGAYMGQIRYSHSDDSINFHTATVTRLSIDSSGRVIMPYQPAFSVTVAAEQTNIAVGADVTVVWGTEVFDVGANFASNTFTAPVTGKYQLSLNLRLNNVDSATAYYIVSFFSSNRNYRFIYDSTVFAADADYWATSLSALVDMDEDDTVTVTVRQSDGTAQTDVDGNAVYQQFTGYLAC